MCWLNIMNTFLMSFKIVDGRKSVCVPRTVLLIADIFLLVPRSMFPCDVSVSHKKGQADALLLFRRSLSRPVTTGFRTSYHRWRGTHRGFTTRCKLTTARNITRFAG